MYCSNLPPCPEPRKPVDGGWGPHGSWSECSEKCGGGFRFRQRMCDDPIPQNGGLECSGCGTDFEVCNVQPCPDIQKLGPWTPWLQQNGNTTANGEHFEKRFRFLCRFNDSDPSGIKVLKAKEENRICFSDGSCHRVADEINESGFGEWSIWSNCTVTCGGGQQYRTRTCERKNCDGHSQISRPCNVQACTGL